MPWPTDRIWSLLFHWGISILHHLPQTAFQLAASIIPAVFVPGIPGRRGQPGQFGRDGLHRTEDPQQNSKLHLCQGSHSGVQFGPVWCVLSGRSRRRCDWKLVLPFLDHFTQLARTLTQVEKSSLLAIGITWASPDSAGSKSISSYWYGPSGRAAPPQSTVPLSCQG